MPQEEQTKRILQQISGQHEALQAAYKKILCIHDAGTVFCPDKLKEIADLYWDLRARLERLPDAASNNGGSIELDFV